MQNCCLSISAMYKNCVEQLMTQNRRPVKESRYRSVFCSEFNLGFGSNIRAWRNTDIRTYIHTVPQDYTAQLRFNGVKNAYANPSPRHFIVSPEGLLWLIVTAYANDFAVPLERL